MSALLRGLVPSRAHGPEPHLRPAVSQPCSCRHVPSRMCVARASTSASAKDAVEAGTECFEKGNFEEALQLYRSAMQMNPNEDEARAAMYNLACAHAKLRQWQQAADAVKSAVNDYKLKVEVAQQDPDLRKLRERREWLDAQDDMAGVVARETRLNLRSEAKAPFRLARTAIAGGLALGAGLGLLIISTRLIAALAGAEGAPDLSETLQSFGINLAAFVGLAFVVSKDVEGKSRDVNVIDREEQLGRLQIALDQGDRVVPLAKFRGSVRPIIIAGSRSYVNKCRAAVKPFKPDLVARGVSLIPVVMSENDPDAKLRALKAEMSRANKKGRGGAAAEAGESGDDAGALSTQDKKWELKAHNISEWIEWIALQTKERGLSEENYYLQVQLDGSVRTSGAGIPSFYNMVSDLPPLDDVRTRFMDGVGPQVD